MNEKAITLTVFFISVFLLYQVRFIVRLRKLRKINDNVIGKGLILEAYSDCCYCCCSTGSCDCPCLFLPCELLNTEIDEVYKIQQEKRAEKQSDEVERKNIERRKIEKKEYIAKLEREKIERQEKVEALRANGYKASERDRNKVLDIVSLNPKTGLPWTSTTTRIPVEEIVLIIESEPDFEIKDEYIVNKKKIQEKEDKIIIAKITCPNCENLFEQGSEFCPNCGQTLK